MLIESKRDKQNSSKRSRKLSKHSYGQAILEFCFAAVIFVMLAYGMVRVVKWVLANLTHDTYQELTVF